MYCELNINFNAFIYFSEWRYILAGSSDGLIAIYDSNSNNQSPKNVAEVVGITSNSNPIKSSISVVQWHPFDNGLFVSSRQYLFTF